MNLSQVLSLIGGIGMFIYGMKIMGGGLEKAAGSKLKTIIEKLTSTLFRGIIVGALVTGIIQSSTATTVIVVGLVNAGAMSLMQAVGVIMGANVGSTLTAQILRLGDIQSSAWYLTMLKPASIAPIMLIIGVVMLTMCKRKKKLAVGEILVGFGLLFLGMSIMEGAVSDLRDMPGIQQAFSQFQNPLLGLLAGIVITVIVQSSAASIGMLQALSATGIIPFSAAVPIILGQNIGTCVTAMMSSIGTVKTAKKAALIHLYFSLIGTIVFMPLIYLFNHFIGITFWNLPVNRGDIANFHLAFNVACTALLFPFASLLVKLADKTIGGKAEKKRSSFLDERLLSSPSTAIEETEKEIEVAMGYISNSITQFLAVVVEGKVDQTPKMLRNQSRARMICNDTAVYIGKIIGSELSETENDQITSLYHVLNSVQNVNGKMMSMVWTYNEMKEKRTQLSSGTKKELAVLLDAMKELFDLACKGYIDKDIETSEKVRPLAKVIGELKDKIANEYVTRHAKKAYDATVGVLHLNQLEYITRIATHSKNIADAITQGQVSDDKKTYKMYLTKYAKP